LSHAQIRNDMSNKRKAEQKARENDEKSTKNGPEWRLFEQSGGADT
jgi:hypothetical protein